MARYASHERIAAAALDIAEQVRDTAPAELYRHLTNRCARDPEAMAQIVMCLGIWLDPTTSTLQLARRAEAVGQCRVRTPGAAS
jgi:hypothetical protein